MPGLQKMCIRDSLNRIDDIVVFHPLGMAQIEKIVDIQLADVRARMAKERMTQMCIRDSLRVHLRRRAVQEARVLGLWQG